MKKKQDQTGASGGPEPGKANSSGPGKSGRLDREVQVKIGHQLRAMYEDYVKQGTPDHLEDIVRRFEKKD